MTRALISIVGAVLLAAALGGCLFRAAEAPRFYRPASAALDTESPTDAPDEANGSAIRLQTVRSTPFLRERVVWRVSTVEYGLYEQRRWFELPSRYVRRALTATLAHTPGLHLVDDPAAARLEVELLAFDEVLAPEHHANVALAVKLRDGTRTRLDRTFAARVPILSDDGAAMAEAMGKALDEAARSVAAAAAAELAAKPARPRRARGTK